MGSGSGAVASAATRLERSILRIIGPQAMDLLAEPGVVVRVRMNKAVEGVHHFPHKFTDFFKTQERVLLSPGWPAGGSAR